LKIDEYTQKIYNLLQDIFKNVWEQQKYSEIKNSLLLTFNIAFFAIILRVSVSISDTIRGWFTNPHCKIFSLTLSN